MYSFLISHLPASAATLLLLLLLLMEVMMELMCAEWFLLALYLRVVPR